MFMVELCFIDAMCYVRMCTYSNAFGIYKLCWCMKQRHGSGVELRALDYENPGSNLVLRH